MKKFMLRQKLNTGHINVLTMSENFVNILPTGVMLINFTVSNQNCLSLVILNYLIVS